jgi:dimethylhistidine N-methyltransferase
MQQELAYAAPSSPGFMEEVLNGLSLQQKSLPSRFFYDKRGSELFELITGLPEYYPTRTESALLRSSRTEIRNLVPPRAAIVEFGSGSSRKTELLLEALDSPSVYIPIEISPSALYPAAARIARNFPGLTVHPVLGGFHNLERLRLPPPNGAILGFFPGSTIGNLTPPEAVDFLAAARKLLGPGSLFLVGADLQKPLDILIPAYDDAEGVTAAFNRNILSRINRELSGNFVPGLFAHRARYNEAEGRIEMHLEALRAHRVLVASRSFEFRLGETIHTENSYKYTVDGFGALAKAGGWSVRRTFIDGSALFSLHLLA